MSETIPQLDLNTRILHVLTESHSVLAKSAKIAIQSQLDAGFRVAVAARESVFTALGLSGGWLRHIEIGAAAGLRPDDPASAFRLHKYYRHINLVHAHGLHAAALAGAGLTGLPASMHPVIVATIGRTDTEGLIATASKQLVAKTATAVLGTTAPLVEEYAKLVALAERADLPEADAEGIAQQPIKSRAEIRRQFDVPTGSWLVSVPAALIDSAPVTTIVEGLTKLPQARADRSWTVIFTGGGSARHMVERDIVDQFGHLRTAPEYLTADVVAASDIVVASDNLTVLNAESLMELQRPVVFVGSKKAGQKYGTVVPVIAPDDTQGFMAAVEHFADHPEARALAAIRLRDRVAVGDTDVDSQALLDLYARATRAACGA